jgi:hypothetical protein
MLMASTKRIRSNTHTIPPPKAIHFKTPPPDVSPIAARREATAKNRHITIGRMIAPAIAKAILWRGIGDLSIIVFLITPILLVVTVSVKDVAFIFLDLHH